MSRTTQKTQPTTRETCPVPQMTGPITQNTAPTLSRGGRQDRIRGNHPRPSPRKSKQTNEQTNKQYRNTPARKNPDPKTRKTSIVEKTTPQSPGKRQEKKTLKHRQINIHTHARIHSYPLQSGHISLRGTNINIKLRWECRRTGQIRGSNLRVKIKWSRG